MTRPKPFQQATVEVACEVLSRRTGKPRFLVADEVGLGKTIVAQQVIAKLTRYRRRPLVVYYVSSSLTIASQNGLKLVEEVSSDVDPNSALCVADRLSMLPFTTGPTHQKVHLYTLTPDTSLPNRQGRRRDGRKDERALIAVLLRQCWPGLDEAFFAIFPRQASRHWLEATENAENRLSLMRNNRSIGLTHMRMLFKDKVREQLDLVDGQHVPPVLMERAEQDSLGLIASLRTALVECTFELDGFQPDLVIFDEFQRFRDLVKPMMGLDGNLNEIPGAVLSQLRGDAGKVVPLLLLSATPYSLYNHRDEESLFGSHHDQLLELLCFLYGDGTEGLKEARLAQKLFKELGNRLRGTGQELDYAAIQHASREIELHLTRVMSRTERAMVLKQSSSEQGRKSPEPIEVATEPADWLIFRHLSERFPERYRSSAITYWRSVPLPMQTMGSSYIAWDKANMTRQRSPTKPVAFVAEHVARNRKLHWPHGKLRALVDHVGPDSLCLPWLPPSLPWWSLHDRWVSEKAQQGKVLLFSRFRATPKAVAAALSHEARVKAARLGNMPKSGTSLRINIERMPVFALFYPSLWLAKCSDPLKAAGKSPAEVKHTVRKQLEQQLKERNVKVTKDKRVRREFWKLLASLDGHFSYEHSDWNGVIVEQNDAIQAWEDAATESVETISQGDLNLLADYALGAPGVVLTRSLLRHCETDLSTKDYTQLIQFSLNDWRHYFDNSVFVATLSKRKRQHIRKIQYTESLRQAVFDGNLEAVLDEYFWFMAPEKIREFNVVLTELSTALGIHGGRVAFHNPDSAEVVMRCQCDVAMPLAQELEAETATGEARPPRTDQIRKAFNSPFWPFVLTTTSVGQEGLDFHPWCKTLLHWDLPGNPVDLEQREGRIQRYGGLAVRRRMAADHGSSVLAGLATGESPWRALANVVNRRFAEGGTGLEPWWHYPAAEVKSYFFHLPASEEAWQLDLLKQQRAVYRLALGQQHQEDFVRMVSTRDPETIRRLADLTPDLSAWKQLQTRK